MGGGAAARALLRHVLCPSPAPSTRAPLRAVLSRAPCLAGASPPAGGAEPMGPALRAVPADAQRGAA